jgi:RNA polymerase sigma-70 factor (ECF subfamily)
MERTADEIADELLVLNSQAGSAVAWKRLVHRWHPKMFAQAKRAAGSPEAAADITQEAWLAILRSIRRLDDPAKFRAWSHRIVANKTADWIRRKQSSRQLIQNVAEEKQPTEADHSQATDSARQEKVETVRNTIKQLPQEQRRLLALFYVEGKSIKEIAQRLSIPQGTVKSRLHSIRQEMKSQLKGQER